MVSYGHWGRACLKTISLRRRWPDDRRGRKAALGRKQPHDFTSTSGIGLRTRDPSANSMLNESPRPIFSALRTSGWRSMMTSPLPSLGSSQTTVVLHCHTHRTCPPETVVACDGVCRQLRRWGKSIIGKCSSPQ